MTNEDWDEMEANDYAPRPTTLKETIGMWLVIIGGTGVACLILAMLAAWVVR